MPREAVRFIIGILYMIVGLLFLVQTIRDAGARGRQRRREDATPPASRPTASRDLGIRLALGTAIVLAGAGFLPIFKDGAPLLITPMIVLLIIVWLLKPYHAR
ncbi:MAG: hypothetical protein IVW57_18490 [Ktedonobacterales bacterium]|nr:hypothetical protein [Ktedonobacterales bacterium]